MEYDMLKLAKVASSSDMAADVTKRRKGAPEDKQEENGVTSSRLCAESWEKEKHGEPGPGAKKCDPCCAEKRSEDHQCKVSRNASTISIPKYAGYKTAPAEQGEWKQVGSKKATKPKKINTKKARFQNALIVHREETHTYADILRKVKTGPALKEVGGKVDKLRRTGKGDLLLVFLKTKTEEVEKFREVVRQSLPPGGTDIRDGTV